MEDLHLLREYAERRSEPAFTELVGRHVNLVYSAALRVLGDPPQAEDVAQTVFLQLARKAGSLKPGTIVSGWLYRTACYVAADVWRADQRRRRRDETAMQLSEVNSEPASVWSDVAPLLEEAMADLEVADQDALVLRFFEDRSLREVGAALGVSDDAAQKRVSRALDKLRDQLERRGVAASSALVTTAIAAHAVQAAPAGLAASIVATSLAGATEAAVGTLAVGFAKALALAKLKGGAVALAAGILLLAGTGAVLLFKLWPRGVRPQDSARQVPALTNYWSSTSQPTFFLRGTVRAPNGKPVTGALVRLATLQRRVPLYRWPNPGVPTVRSGPDGGFVFALAPPSDMKMAIVVDSSPGYALVTAEELGLNPDVIVQPWGRIEGVLWIGKNRGANQTVNLGIWGSDWAYDWTVVSHSLSVPTDAEGRFVFPRVAPVEVWGTRRVMARPGEGRESGHQCVKVLPGQTTRVQLGGIGRPVTGQVEWASAEGLVFSGSMWSSANSVNDRMRLPPGWRQMTAESRRLYERKWRTSPEGEEWKHQVRNYEFPVAPDGTFRVDDVVAGSYRMQVRAEAPGFAGQGRRQIAVAEVIVEVPDLPEGHSDEPLDIGVLRPKPTTRR